MIKRMYYKIVNFKDCFLPESILSIFLDEYTKIFLASRKRGEYRLETKKIL